jgi:hypothetical protein
VLPAGSHFFDHGETYDLVGCPEEGAELLFIPCG